MNEYYCPALFDIICSVLPEKRVMPSEYLGNLYNKITSEFLDNYMHHFKDINISNIREEKRKNENELNEVIWKDKNIRRKRKFDDKDGYYKNSSIFGRSNNILNCDKENIMKLFSNGKLI